MITLETIPDKNLTAVGIDLGGTFIKAGIVSSSGKILNQVKIRSGAEVSPAKVIERIRKCINQLLKKNNKTICGIGIGAPGIVRDGLVQHPPNFKNWKIVNLKKETEKYSGIQTELDNDANCAALAELKFGKGKKIRDFLFVTLGTGIGGGIIIDGKLYKGEKGGAGEFGMMTINFNGHECLGGNRGALESYLGRKYFLKNERGLISQLDKKKPDKTDFDQLTVLAAIGNKTAKLLFKKYGFYLGVGLANYFNLMDVRTAVLSGGISNAFKYFIGECRKTIRERCLLSINKEFRVLKSVSSNEAGILGAAALVFDSFRENK
jgi:glucokinase